MTTYVIGDLQGCLTPLKRLLDHLQFEPAHDTLWFVGDLINRGPESLETLRYVKALGKSAITVLGNHDLHLLAVVHGIRKASSKDTLEEIVRAPDRDELCHWLARRPLLHTDKKLGHTLVHAGIHPLWSLKRAHKMAREIHHTLKGDLQGFLATMYGNTPTHWNKNLPSAERQRFAVNAFTRMRYCYADGQLNFDFNGAPSAAPDNLYPWYAITNRKALDTQIVFGHWSSHPSICKPGIIPTDRGCVWGGSLAAYAIESGSSHWVS
ncbi:MAG: bis(5'-nucleosyl)-tetraphosphatase (symmetrical) [Flavobacteriaceae bacterium]|jgi:bis(5'-nucleosyl)-tetraphosphatase (symmetrical)